MHTPIMLRDFAVPNEPQIGCARLAAVRLIAECADMFPLVSDCPHICCLHNQLSEVECVRQIKTKTNAVRLKTPLPLRMARVPTITLPSRGFGCCTPKTTSSPRHHLRDPPTTASTASSGDTSMSAGDAHLLLSCPLPPHLSQSFAVQLSLQWPAALHRKHLPFGILAFPAPPFELAVPSPSLPLPDLSRPPCVFPPFPPKPPPPFPTSACDC